MHLRNMCSSAHGHHENEPRNAAGTPEQASSPPFSHVVRLPSQTEARIGAAEHVRDARAYDGYHPRDMPGTLLFIRSSRKRSDWLKLKLPRPARVRCETVMMRCSLPDRALRDRTQTGVSMVQMVARSAPCSHRLRPTDKKFERTAVYNKTGTALTRESLRLGDRGVHRGTQPTWARRSNLRWIDSPSRRVRFRRLFRLIDYCELPRLSLDAGFACVPRGTMMRA